MLSRLKSFNFSFHFNIVGQDLVAIHVSKGDISYLVYWLLGHLCYDSIPPRSETTHSQQFLPWRYFRWVKIFHFILILIISNFLHAETPFIDIYPQSYISWHSLFGKKPSLAIMSRGKKSEKSVPAENISGNESVAFVSILWDYFSTFRSSI